SRLCGKSDLPLMRAGLRSKPPLPPASEGRPGRPRIALSKHLEAFLEMLAAERGAASLTLAAYHNDLSDLAGFLAARGSSLEIADPAAFPNYLASASTARLAPRTLARRVSAMRQFYKFLLLEGVQPDDPTTDLDTPRLGRPLPKILSETEVERLI